MRSLLKSFADRLGIDRAVSYVLLAKLWSVGGGLITLSLVTTRLTLPEQGTYYTFANILGLQIFLELGLGFVVMQVASHEVARLQVGEAGVLSGDVASKSRLSSLLRGTVKIYAAIAAAFLLLILPLGAFFFHRNAPAEVNWTGPWILLVAVAAVAILINPLMAFMEGCGRVAEVEGRRLSFAVTGNILCWILLLSGAHLYCTIALYTAMAVGGAVWFWRKHRIWLGDLWRAGTDEHTIGWATEVWPFQWRIALSWLSGYFIFQLFNPLLYAYAGAAEAGKMGLTLQISNLFGGIAYGWVNTKVPLFGKYVARREWAELDRAFGSVLLKSSLVLGGLLLGAWTGLALLPWLSNHVPTEVGRALIGRFLGIRARMLPGLGIAALFTCIFSQHLIACLATYLRSHKKEPMLWVSLVMGFLVAIAAYFSARSGAAQSVAISWCTIQWLVALPWTLILFFRLRRVWHT